MVTIDDFAKLEFKVGTIISAEEIEGSDRLLKLQVDFGVLADTNPVISSESQKSLSRAESRDQDEAQSETIEALEILTEDKQIASSTSSPRNDAINDKNDIRQILSGIKQWYQPEDLVGKQFVFITNLAPRKMMGLESQGMIMAAEGEEKPIPLIPSEKVPNGAKIR